MCLVRCLDEGGVFVAEGEVNCLDCVVEMFGIGGADDGGRHATLELPG